MTNNLTSSKKSKTTLYIVASTCEVLSFISMIPFVIYAVMEGNVIPAMSSFSLYLISLGIQAISKPNGIREPMGQ
jgi:hypothetical protein